MKTRIASKVIGWSTPRAFRRPRTLAWTAVRLQLRHPGSAAIKSITVNGKPWTAFDKDKEWAELKDLTGKVEAVSSY